MHINLKKGVMFLGAVTAVALVIDDFRLRVTCRALERVVNYAVGGIHLDGVGGIFDPEDEIGSEADDRHASEGDIGSGSDVGDAD